MKTTTFNAESLNTNKKIENLYVNNDVLKSKYTNDEGQIVTHVSNPEQEYAFEFYIPELEMTVRYNCYRMTRILLIRNDNLDYSDWYRFELINTGMDWSINNINEVINTCINYADEYYKEIMKH